MPKTSFFRNMHRSFARYPWSSIVAFLTGIIIGASVIVNPAIWMLILGVLLVGNSAYSMAIWLMED